MRFNFVSILSTYYEKKKKKKKPLRERVPVKFDATDLQETSGLHLVSSTVEHFATKASRH